MSRLAKKSIPVPSGVTVSVESGSLLIKGAKAELKVKILSHIKVRIEPNEVWVDLGGTDKEAKTNAGTVWSLTKNAIEGVTAGFTKTLEIEGVGYRAVLEGKELVLHLGYVNPVRYPINDGVVVTVEKNVIKVSGTDKDLVGRTAATIRAFKKPEPYKGKGIRYQGEVIRRKVGKKAGAAAA